MQSKQHRNNPAPLLALVALGATVDGELTHLGFNAAYRDRPAEVWVGGYGRVEADVCLRFDAQGRLLNTTPVTVRREAAELLATLGLQFDSCDA